VSTALGPDSKGSLSVPPLLAEDRERLRTGVLPAASEAGRALGWLARDLAGRKVGFAFGAGSLRGYAHAGVLAALERAGLRADYVAGTSVGAAVAALHALGYTPAELADELDRCGEVLFRPTLSRRGLFSNRALRRYLQSVVADRRIEDLSIPLAIVAADLERQQEVVLRRGLIRSAILASISIPGVFPAVRIGGRTLVDGGIINPVPATTASTMGAGAVVAVRLSTPNVTPKLDVVAGDQVRAGISALNVIVRSLEIMQARIASDPSETPLISITPEFADLPGAKLRRFASGRRYMEEGEAAVEAALPRLATLFPWLGR
jgi:NTE family protein